MSNDPTVVGDPAWLYANREAIKAGAEEEIMEALEEYYNPPPREATHEPGPPRPTGRA